MLIALPTTRDALLWLFTTVAANLQLRRHLGHRARETDRLALAWTWLCTLAATTTALHTQPVLVPAALLAGALLSLLESEHQRRGGPSAPLLNAVPTPIPGTVGPTSRPPGEP